MVLVLLLLLENRNEPTDLVAMENNHWISGEIGLFFFYFFYFLERERENGLN